MAKQKIDHEALALTTVSQVGQDNIQMAVKALTSIKNTAKKQRGYYLTFGQVWLQIRKLTNGNTKAMGYIRKHQFKDIIDAQTASYAARMAEDWDKIKPWADGHMPNCNNPRPLVQAWVRWKTAEEKRIEAEKKEKAAKEAELKEQLRRSKLSKEELAAEEKAKEEEEKRRREEEEKELAKKGSGNVHQINSDLAPALICTDFVLASNNLITALNQGKIAESQAKEIEKQIQAVMKKLQGFYIGDKETKNVA